MLHCLLNVSKVSYSLKYFTWMLYEFSTIFIFVTFRYRKYCKSLEFFTKLGSTQHTGVKTYKFLEFSLSHLISSTPDLFNNPLMELIWPWISMYSSPIYSNSNANKHALYQCEMKMVWSKWRVPETRINVSGFNELYFILHMVHMQLTGLHKQRGKVHLQASIGLQRV